MPAAAPQDVLVCPLCRASQQPSETCRRCRCDLTLVVRAERAARETRRRLLRHFACRRWEDALRDARAFYFLKPGADARRLLAVCSLLAGEFKEALAGARWN